MAPRRKRPQRVLRGPLDPSRFAAGWRLVEPMPGFDVVAIPTAEQPSLTVDVTRGRDLVGLTVEFYACELATGGDGPIVRPVAGGDGRVVVRLPFQHLGERAVYEEAAPVANEMNPSAPPAADPAVDAAGLLTPWPLGVDEAVPARSSRLVFTLPTGDTVPFSSEGILAAIGRLPMVVHPLATPRPARRPLLEGSPVVVLPSGLSATLGASSVHVARATTAAATAADTLSRFRNLRHTRTVLATRGGSVTATAADAAPTGTTEITLNGRAAAVGPLFGAGGLVTNPGRVVVPRPRTRLSSPPTELQTALEAPYRLVISPSAMGGWTHASSPVGAAGAEHRVELWHTRLGVRDAEGRVDERSREQRIVRAVWARDRELLGEWQTVKVAPHTRHPSRMSLDVADRHMLVRQSSETWSTGRITTVGPEPVDADALWLSALGARLDLHGRWDTEPYSQAQMASILRWDHLAPWGRDQYVVVVYPGYLFPFGHRCALVKVTERKTKTAANSVAGLYQRMFLVLGERTKTYDDKRLPFTEVWIGPEQSPVIQDPGEAQNSFFWPVVAGTKWSWTLSALDHERRRVPMHTPLLWVAEHFGDVELVNASYEGAPESTIALHGAKVAFTPVRTGGDTMAPATSIKVAGEQDGLRSRPLMRTATIEVPAVQALSGTGPVTITYAAAYAPPTFGSGGGFGAAAGNPGEVWAELVTPVTMGFGAGQPAGSDKAGGFLSPDVPVRGLSRLAGTVGDVAGAAQGTFDPATYLAGALPKLFGLVPITELLALAGLDKAPNLVSEAVDRIEGFLADLDRARAMAAEAVADAQRLVDRAAGKAADFVDQAQATLAAAQTMATQVDTAAAQVIDAVVNLPNATREAVEHALLEPPGSLFDTLRQALDAVEGVAPQLPPLVKHRLSTLASLLRRVLDAEDVIDDIVRFVNGFDPSALQVQFRYEWRPLIRSWPNPDHPFLGITEPLLIFKPEGDGPRDNLVLGVEGRASGKGEMGVEVLAELRDFALLLLPGEPLVRFDFDHLSFKTGSAGKAEVDVVLGEIEFLGLLGFVETLKELIPFDGFSDPPYLEVSPAGVVAGFSLALPSVAIGVFALSNISLGADVSVPFLGKTLTVGFNFCTRERPFTLQVTFIGGGGWFLIRLSPDGLDVLELGLEAGATLSVDLGVASGSISAMIGVYMRLEGDSGSLTAYFRLRGEVDVLGIISASIELYLELTYVFDTGKLHGLARLTIEIDVFIFSGSVTIECERTFAGSKGDPTFAQLMAVAPDGASEPWSEYCAAFAAAPGGA
jgi:hypothetical protein